MLTADINFWFILLSGVISSAVGFFWYGPVFGKAWMKYAVNLDPSNPEDTHKIEEMKKKATVPMITSIFGWLVTAYVLSHIFALIGVATSGEALQVVFWLWLGLIMPFKLSNVLYQGRPLALVFIDTGYWLITLSIVSIVLAL